jgi:hypothetical protein
MPVPTFLGGVLWSYVISIFQPSIFITTAVYVVAISIGYMIGIVPITSPVSLWYMSGRFVLVFMAALAGAVPQYIASIWFADHGKLWAINPDSSSYLSKSVTLTSTAAIIVSTGLIVILEFIADIGIGTEILIAALLCGFIFVSYMMMKGMKFPNKVGKNIDVPEYIFWSHAAAIGGVVFICLWLFGRFILWPFVEPDFFVMLCAIGSLLFISVVIGGFILWNYIGERIEEEFNLQHSTVPTQTLHIHDIQSDVGGRHP